jgi:hypothetical protein
MSSRITSSIDTLQHASSQMASTKRPSSIPPFSSLPLNKGDPLWSAWGLYGKDDELGMLNRLTDEVVKEAAKEEIRTGVRWVAVTEIREVDRG